MPTAKNVKNIVIHCTAGFGDVNSIKAFWKNVLGWKHPGYHIIIDELGVIHELAELSEITNGVKGYNHSSIHISYIGGVRKTKSGYVAEDTRTTLQKRSLHVAIQEVIEWLGENGKDITTDLGVVGHRDFSNDKNGNEVIDRWERIKECPSFDAMKEYSGLYATTDRYLKLPTFP